MPHLIETHHDDGRGALLRALATFSLSMGDRMAERRVARALRPLERDGWRILHGVEAGAGTIDHVAIGPGGIFALETKAPCGRVTVSPDEVVRLRTPHDPQTSYEMRQLATRLRGDAGRLKRRIARTTSLKLFVHAVVVFDEGFDSDVVEGRMIAFASRDRLAAWLAARPAHQADAVTVQVVAALTGRG